jgi:hypothetical protein
MEPIIIFSILAIVTPLWIIVFTLDNILKQLKTK